MKVAVLFTLVFVAGMRLAGERINQEGRLLGPEPTVAGPILFNTPEADAVVGALQIMPLDSPWNEDISSRPLLANSDAMIAQIRADLSASRRTLRAFYEMNFVLVPEAQPYVPIAFVDYPDESDPGPVRAHNPNWRRNDFSSIMISGMGCSSVRTPRTCRSKPGRGRPARSPCSSGNRM